MRKRPTTLLALAAATLALTTACAGDDLAGDETDNGSGDAPSVTISGQSFPEATLVAAMYEQVLEDQGYDVTVKLVDTRDVYMADGQFPEGIQIVPEYVGGLVEFLNVQANGPDAEPLTTNDAEGSVQAALDLVEERGITLLNPSEATDQNAFFVTQEFAEKNGVVALSDLEGESVTLAAAPDCEGRSDCEAGLSNVYGIDIKEVLPLGFASDATYQSVLNGESQLGLTSTTDGTLADQGLLLLDDDRGIQPAQNLIPAVSADWAADDANVEAVDALNALMAALTTEKLTALNGQVSVERAEPVDVAADFLATEGLV